jgi:hypothetical protein
MVKPFRAVTPRTKGFTRGVVLVNSSSKASASSSVIIVIFLIPGDIGKKGAHDRCIVKTMEELERVADE